MDPRKLKEKLKERAKIKLSPRNTYNKFSSRCRCGSWLPKGSWVRFRDGQIVACVACRSKEDEE